MFEIALCTFSFKNGLIIRLLDERGDSIRDNEPGKIIEIN